MPTPAPPVHALAHQADRLFTRALDLPESEREAFIAAQAGSNEALRLATSELLVAERESRRYFEPARQAGARTAVLQDTPSADRQGLRIGPYRLTRRLGHGGTAVVYLGQREGGDFNQQVAVKLLRRMVVTPDEVMRFKLERQILSSLNHPQIARLLDGGTLPDGQPYLITEFIDGLPITEHAQQRQLNIRARLALFLQVAAAVHHAHSQRVIHRDIKPSNVLVAADGSVHLLDFGIAKRMADEHGNHNEHAAALTRFNQRLMTPEYAAPEQRSGAEITTATDVFQLGVLLHELLTGERPPPPDGTAPPALASLNRELQAILKMALQPDPARRFASAAALGEDLQRHLRAEAILAQPDTAIDTLRRLLQSHRVAAAALGLSLLLGAGWLVNGHLHAEELARERDAATASAQRTQRAYELLTDVVRQADPLDSRSQGGRGVTIWQSLDRTAARVRTQLPDDPTTRAELLGTLAALYRAGERHAPARSLLQDALAAQRLASGPRSAQTAVLMASLGSLERDAGRTDAARAYLSEALALARALPAEQAPQAVSVWLTAGFSALNDGDALTALALFERAAPLAEATPTPDPNARIEAQFGLASARRLAGDVAGAEAPAQRAVQLTEQHFGADHARMAGPLSAWANIQRELGRPEQAAQALNRSIELLTREYGPHSGNVLSARNNLALALEMAGQTPQAQAELTQVLALRREFNHGEMLELAAAYQNLGSSLANHDQAAEALPLLAQARALYDRHLPATSPRRAFPRLSSALSHLVLRQPTQAEGEATQALTILQGTLPDNHPAIAVARCLRGEALLALGQPAQGGPLVRKALPVLRAAKARHATYAARCERAAAIL